jgi:molybdopterin-guanine dinucleotide biosynthesis protein A
MNFSNFTGYVLAGGKSSRMGVDKAFLEINGQTFIERAVKNLSEACENRVKIVLNRNQTHFIEKLPVEVRHIFDEYENRGALGGIQAALKDCETKYAIILAVDLPLVNSRTFVKLVEIAESSNKFIAVVPRQSDGRLQPLCAVYNVRFCLSPLENLLNQTDSASVRVFLELIAPRVIDQNKLSDDDSKDVFFNVNHPTDFGSLELMDE